MSPSSASRVAAPVLVGSGSSASAVLCEGGGGIDITGKEKKGSPKDVAALFSEDQCNFSGRIFSHAKYILPEELATTMVDVERIVPGGVVCMYSAWDYYGLTTQIPDGFYVAIEKHRKVVVPEISGIVLCYWEEKYCTMGVEEADIANHKVKIFCIEKSVCDAVKFRNKIGTEVAVEILRNYLKRKDRNISRLMDYAKQMRVLSTMRQYLEMGL